MNFRSGLVQLSERHAFGGVLLLIFLMRVEVTTERLFLSCPNEGLSLSALRGCEPGWPVCAANE